MVMENSGGDTMAMGVKCAESMVAKSLDNIVGNLWQARQESSGSSMGNQSPRNGDDLSDVENDADAHTRESSPDGSVSGNVRVKDARDLLKDKDPDKLDHDLMRDPRAFLSGLPGLTGLQGLEAFHRHRDLLSSPQNLLSAATAGLRNGPLLPPTSLSMGPFGMSPLPARPPSQPATPSSQSSSPIQQTFGSNQQNWSFEEQFKQCMPAKEETLGSVNAIKKLYEIDDNPKRKEFLDELFSYMQKLGSPINRLPIMAKQVLDLFELFNLVIARGGLVEVINKKLWQEVIKGLGLPSSITSAAFTLRTQYTKYLYPLECRKKNLSKPNELQAAIEGNKREGRRGSYGSFPSSDMMPLPHHGLGLPGLPSQITPMSLVTNPHRQFNGGSHHGLPPNSSPGSNGVPQDPLSALEMTRLALWKMYNQAGAAAVASDLGRPGMPNMPGLSADLMSLGMPHAGHMVGDQRHRIRDRGSSIRDDFSDSGKCDDVDITESNKDYGSDCGKDIDEETPRKRISPPIHTPPEARDTRNQILEGEEDLEEEEEEDLDGPVINGNDYTTSVSPPPAKKARRSPDLEDDPNLEMTSPRKLTTNALGLPGANIKISSRGDGRNGETSLVVSMEINGTTFQGVLFAQPIKPRPT